MPRFGAAELNFGRRRRLNILTKICVVVLVVVNLFASAVFIAYANSSENWKQRCENFESAKLAAEITAGNELAHASLLQTERAALQAQLVTERGSAQEKIAELKIQLDKREKDWSALQISQQGIDTQIGALRSEVQTMNSARTALEAALSKANEDKATFQRDITELQGKLAQAEADSRRQDGTIRVQRADIANLREQIERLSSLVASGGGAADTGVASGGQAAFPVANIRGQVTAVQGDALSINVGSAKGVREGMVLVIHRKDKLVGYLRIDEVEVDEAVGIIEEKQSDPQKGDTVYQKDM